MYLLRKWKLQSIIYMYRKDPYSSSRNTITIYVYSMYPSVFNPYIYNPSYIYIWVYPNCILEYVEFHFEAIAWFSYTPSVPKRMEFSSFKVRLVETWNYAYVPTLYHCIWEFLTNSASPHRPPPRRPAAHKKTVLGRILTRIAQDSTRMVEVYWSMLSFPLPCHCRRWCAAQALFHPLAPRPRLPSTRACLCPRSPRTILKSWTQQRVLYVLVFDSSKSSISLF
jgi:hypothetical protein